MSNIIESFELDMADELDISFAKAAGIVNLMVNYQKTITPAIARQKIVNALANAIENDREAAEQMFEKTLEQKDTIVALIDKYDSDKAMRSMNNTMRNIRKLVTQLSV